MPNQVKQILRRASIRLLLGCRDVRREVGMRARCGFVTRGVFVLFLAGVGAGCAGAPTADSTQERALEVAASGHDHRGHHPEHAEVAFDGPPPPSSFAEKPPVGTHFTCPVSGGVFEVEPHTRMSFYEGRYYAFCCGGCKQDFDANPVRFVDAPDSSQP
jgi:YHS domain-containing protein